MNKIWYRFSCEKEKFELDFRNTKISVEEVKKLVVERRNMKVPPEPFELKISNEETKKELEDKDYVMPMEYLIIKRYPKYKFDNNYKDTVREPKDIPLNNERASGKDVLQKLTRYSEPLEKIKQKLNKEKLISQFKCPICSKFDEKTISNLIITKCCKETFCLDCYNKNENQCIKCQKSKIGYVPKNTEYSQKLCFLLGKTSARASRTMV